MEQWKIQRAKKGCCIGCGTTLALDEHVALLRLPDCVREEMCRVCFAEMANSGQELPFHWRVRRRASGKKEAVLDLQGLRVLFDKLGEIEQDTGSGSEVETDEENPPTTENAAALRYLVALLLLRKRVLKMADARNEVEERADLLVYDPKIEGMEPVALAAPDPEAGNLQDLREELLSMAGLAEPEGETQAG